MADAPLLELLARLLHLLHVGFGAHDDAHARGIDLEVVELRLHLGGGLRRGRLLAHATRSTARRAMSRRSWRPSKWIISAAAYAASRAAPGPSPSAVTLSTRPPAVTTAPSSRRAVPAWVTSMSAGTPSSPSMTSPLDEDCG